jgi:hypothetical protein
MNVKSGAGGRKRTWEDKKIIAVRKGWPRLSSPTGSAGGKSYLNRKSVFRISGAGMGRE